MRRTLAPFLILLMAYVPQALTAEEPLASPAAEAAMRTGLDRALEGKTYLAVETGCGKLLEGQGCSKRLKTEGPWSC